MSNLDELRNLTLQDDEEQEADVFAGARKERRYFGMTSVELMIVSIFLFMNVVVLALAVLVISGRLTF